MVKTATLFYFIDLLGLPLGSALPSTFWGCSASFFGKKAALCDWTCLRDIAKKLSDYQHTNGLTF